MFVRRSSPKEIKVTSFTLWKRDILMSTSIHQVHFNPAQMVLAIK